MCQANNEKWKKRITERIELPNQKKSQNALKKENIQVPCNSRSGHQQTNGDVEKTKKSISGEQE